MNHSTVRKDFPLINRLPLVYLDNAATSHKPQIMLDALQQFYADTYGTVHRGLYALGENATTNYEQARTTVAQFINTTAENIIFTKGTTESINLVAASWGIAHLKTGDEILLTEAEHHANLLPWQWVAEQTGAKLVFIPLDHSTFLLQNPASYLSAKTKLVAITMNSNVLGPIWKAGDLAKITQLAHQFGALVLLDAAQAVAHQPIDAQALGADFIVFSGHKLFGPTGSGVLYAKYAIQETMQPYQRGGSMVYEAWFDHASWQHGPQKFEAGTPLIGEAIGLAASINYLQTTVNWQTLHEHETSLCRQLVTGLAAIPRVTIVGNKELLASNGHLVSFVVQGIHAHDIASMLGTRNIAVRAGHLCAQPLVRALGHESLVRVSVALYNTAAEIDIFLHELSETIALFNHLVERP